MDTSKDHWLHRDTTGELLIALAVLPKYQALIATVDTALAETSDAADTLKSGAHRMLAARRAARAHAETRAAAAAQLQRAALRRAASQRDAAHAALQVEREAARAVEQRLVASELGQEILAQLAHKEKELGRENAGVVTRLLGLA